MSIYDIKSNSSNSDLPNKKMLSISEWRNPLVIAFSSETVIVVDIMTRLD